MVCSFDATAGIVRLYGRGRRVDLDDPALRRYRAAFPDDFHPYVRQAFFIDVERLRTSCGYAVPRMTYKIARDTLDKSCERKLEPREFVDGPPFAPARFGTRPEPSAGPFVIVCGSSLGEILLNRRVGHTVPVMQETIPRLARISTAASTPTSSKTSS